MLFALLPQLYWCERILVLGVIKRLPLVPAINVSTPQLAISPKPTVLIGIALPFIVSISAKAACTLPPVNYRSLWTFAVGH